MKKLLLLVIIITLLNSCDRIGKYQFQVLNKSDKVINVSFQDEDNKAVMNKAIKPGESAIIAETGTEILGRNEKPHGIWDKKDTIGYFKNIEIKIEGKLISNDLRIAKYWKYKAENTKVGKYNLEIFDK